VSGRVNLALSIKRDGTVETTNVIDGPAMLRQAAIDSARQSQFECATCFQAFEQLLITYEVKLEGAVDCSENVPESHALTPAIASYPQIVQEEHTVTIIDQTRVLCDPAATISRVQIRSARCLYLWRCGWRQRAVTCTCRSGM
jgi:hypothetical protein